MLGIIILAGCGQSSVVQTQKSKTLTPIQPTDQEIVNEQQADAKLTPDEQALKASAFNAVDKAIKKGTWDKKIEIATIDRSKKAAKGYWWAHDRWDWIAWQTNDGEWKVAVSLDGFDCEEVDGIPDQFNVFFKDVLYRGKERYCFE